MSNSNLLMPPTLKNKPTESVYSERRLDRIEIAKKKAAKKFAAVALAVTMLTSVGVVNRGKISKTIDNVTYTAVDKDISGPKVEAGGVGKPSKIDMIGDINKLTVMSRDEAGKPELYMLDNGATLGVVDAGDGNMFVIESGADIRTAPVVGNPEDGTRTTIVTTEQDVPLNGVKNCLSYGHDSGNGDSFYGFKSGELIAAFPNVKFENVADENDEVWINSKEVSVISSSKR